MLDIDSMPNIDSMPIARCVMRAVVTCARILIETFDRSEHFQDIA